MLIILMDPQKSDSHILCWSCPACREKRSILKQQAKLQKIKDANCDYRDNGVDVDQQDNGIFCSENNCLECSLLDQSGSLGSNKKQRVSFNVTSQSLGSSEPIPVVGHPKLDISMCHRCRMRQQRQEREEQLQSQSADGCIDQGYLHGHNNHNGYPFIQPIPPHASNGKVVPVETDDDRTQSMFVDAFLHNNRLEHMIQVMGYHPDYLEGFLKTQQYLLRGDGPLPYDYRHYIAIMAAGRHQCSYLINIQTTEFLLQGGEESWLKGLEFIPQKLKDLYDINKILAHRPWLINKSHIEKLTRGDDNWSISELMQAFAILASFHALSSFVYGCGISSEIDHEDGHTFRPPSISENNSPDDHSQPNSHSTTPNSAEGEGGIEVLMERMRRLTEGAQEDVTQEELLKRFEKIESQSAELPAALKQPSPKSEILKYVDDPDFTYQDFAKRGQTSEIPTFRAQDYSWEEQGFSFANRLYTDIGTLLDDKFSLASGLTYYTMGDNQDVDTTAFRRAIWNYIHCMFGIRHDDYDYSEVNTLLERSLKAYIKTVTCFPERVGKKDFDSFMKEFKHSEKVHVNLMMLEARLQAELLYMLRALMKYMT